jgi:hypothetical protein
METLENFFYNDVFCRDLEYLIEELDIDDENITELEDDWSVTCKESTLEKMFVIKREFAVDAIVNETDTWVERFPEDSDILFERIKEAIGNAIDIDKLNEGLPSLYYPNGKTFKVTKADLINYFNS